MDITKLIYSSRSIEWCNQKIEKLSESPATVPIVAKSYKSDSKNRKLPKNNFKHDYIHK